MKVGILKINKSRDDLHRFGFANVHVSQPDKRGGDKLNWWNFGNDNVVNDDMPMPCKDSDSKDLAYVRKVLDFIDSHPEMFDNKQVYIGGMVL